MFFGAGVAGEPAAPASRRRRDCAVWAAAELPVHNCQYFLSVVRRHMSWGRLIARGGGTGVAWSHRD
jgi:hypothetical protein